LETLKAVSHERQGIMRLIAMAGLLIASRCWAQEPTPNFQQPPVQVQEPAAPPAQKEPLVVPAGTRIPLTLANPIRIKTARPGDAVRAAAAFPVTVGTQEMIPPGTFVEGSLERVIKKDASGQPALQVHFTRIVFANGYAVALDGAMVQARADTPGNGSPEVSAAGGQVAASTETGTGMGDGFGGGMGFQQQPPPLPPLPGPHYGPIIGVAAGSAAVTILAVVFGHRHRYDNALFDSGWQFEMVLQSPLLLDADKVAAAIAIPIAQ
jgi:hypothetical protein